MSKTRRIKVDTIMAIEIYAVICLLFVTAALVEYAVIMFRNSAVKPAALKCFGLPGRDEDSKSTDSSDSEDTLEEIINRLRESDSDTGRIHGKDDLNISEYVDSSSSFSSLSSSTLSYLTPSTTEESFGSYGYLKLGVVTKWAFYIKDNFDSKLIDAIAFIVFPIAFLVFNGIFWGYYLGKPIDRN